MQAQINSLNSSSSISIQSVLPSVALWIPQALFHYNLEKLFIVYIFTRILTLYRSTDQIDLSSMGNILAFGSGILVQRPWVVSCEYMCQYQYLFRHFMVVHILDCWIIFWFILCIGLRSSLMLYTAHYMFFQTFTWWDLTYYDHLLVLKYKFGSINR